jgi:tetratricopeptide (TPR) repeat protein
LVRRSSKGLFVSTPPPRGLPPRIYLPIVAIIGLGFIAVMVYLVANGFGVTGSVFGKGGATPGAQANAGTNVQGGGPPAAIMTQLKTLRERIASHPNDDVALTQLADMYLAANKFDAAIPLYDRALKINPGNVAAQTGLQQANEALRQR